MVYGGQIYCNYFSQQLDAAALRRTATVVRNRRHILDLRNLDTEAVQRANSGLATRAWALDAHFQVLHAALDGNFACRFSRNLRCKRGRLPRTLEACTTGRRPRQSVALTVGNGDDGVVEGRVDMRDALGNVLFNFLAHACCCGVIRGFCHDYFLESDLTWIISTAIELLCAVPCVCVRWYAYADHVKANLYDDAGRDSNTDPSNA